MKTGSGRVTKYNFNHDEWAPLCVSTEFEPKQKNAVSYYTISTHICMNTGSRRVAKHLLSEHVWIGTAKNS
jgi:hypothetical protein